MNKVKSTPSAATGMDKPTSSTASGRVEDEEVKPYVLAGELGKGSFAVVYRGYHQESHEQVAIKTVSRSILTSKLFDNLQSEIDILKSLSHRHITKLIDIVRAERNIYLIMEFCSGGDLTNYIKKRGRVETLEYVPSPGAAPQYYPHPKVGGLDEIVVRSFLRQLARALKFLRTRNLIHRDIKPQNLLLKPPAPEELARGHPLGVPILKVADFGFARSLPNAMMAETLCGSPLYMAPEILRYEKYDAKADLWSVGAVLYEISFGKPPFRALNHIELLKKIEHTRYIKFPDEDPAYLDKDPSVKAAPEDIKRLIRLLLKRLPTERASFDDFFNSGALANSKFPRPPAPPKTVKKSEPAAPMTIRDEPVIIGTIRSKTKELSLQDSLPIEKHQISMPTDENREVGVPKFHFRRGSYRAEEVMPSADGQYREPQNVLHVVEANTDPKTQDNHRPLSTEASIIPGESEEDGLLRREYVLVGDARAIDFNKAVDEIKAAQRKPLRTRPSLSSPVLEKSPSTPSEVTSPTLSSANTAFPPPPNPFPPPLSSSPSRSSASALTKALSLASRKLFGTSTSRTAYLTDRSPSRSPRRQALLLPRTPEGEAPQVTSEEELLKSLEELAQKTDVLVRWADDMYEYVKAVPTKPLPRPMPVLRADGTMRKKKREVEAEFNAITCVEVYLTLMAFSQKGIDQLRMYSEQTKTHDPNGEFEMSQGFNDALIFFKELFLKCNDRAILVKTWLPEQPSETEMWLDQIVYDRALELSRRAARLELVNQKCSYHEIEQLYEESLWLLYALQDDVMQASNPFAEEDKTTTATWITRTKERLERSRRRREALEQETATAQPPTVTY